MKVSKWASRFIGAAIIQGALATLITLYIVVGQIFFLRPEPSRVIAFGSAGMWFTMGYLTYLIVGVMGVAVTALFYNYIESVLEKPYSGLAEKLAWVHLILMNVGVVGATWLMMLGGYLGGAAMLPPEVGGRGWNPGQVHTNIFYGIPLGYPLWITIFILILAAGAISGGLGFIMRWRSKQPQ
ncbi:MAG: hypothetical protein RMJ28_03155 [Nitrososphaerota archaeon]|nr:hypothetical protein [Candidatus Calditenuaceae archaeon]MDW8073218.1 hypothetical protein [Nitrososphaerota archaeon]